MAKLLFVVSSAPYDNGLTDESHDLIMASTAYGHEASVVFVNDGILQLVKQQTPPDNQKHAGKRIQGFEFFDIEPIYGVQSSMTERNTSNDELIPGVEIIDDEQYQRLIADSDFVITL